MNSVTPVLYAVSNALLIPVALALLGMTLFSLALLGGAVREWPARCRWARERRLVLADLSAGRTPPAELVAGLRHFPRRNLASVTRPGADVLLRAAQQAARRSLAWTSFGSRVGPALGLMGTLIPLGPALTGLASGDLERLASGLVVAFTTTVVGLLVGVLCFSVGLVRSRWFADDLLWLDLLARAAGREDGGAFRV